MKKYLHALIFIVCSGLAAPGWSRDVIHDAEYYVIEAQNGERWDADDKLIDKKLAMLREANDGKPPNILYILLDDLGFGEIGMPDLEVTRGYKTPNIDALAREGLSLQRMYTEPSCTPTRVAMMTGRHPVRTGLVGAKATLAGEGLAAEEVTIAEVLRKSGYATSHVGKWHLGDIQEAWAHNQGFMHAEFPIHQQAQLALFPLEAENADVIRGIDHAGSAQTFTLDMHFAPNPSDMVTGVEVRDGGVYEVDLKPGEKWTQQKYREMNERYQRSAMSELQRLAKQDKPFYLNYWPLFPLNFVRSDIEEYKTLNGGTIAETIVEVDQWIGDLVAEVERQGIADNTLIIVMGDNGPFMKYAGPSGQADRIYRGAKGDTLEGGIRVNAYVRWPVAIEPGTSAMDIFHVSDLFTTLARIGGGAKAVPTDRVIDGIDGMAAPLGVVYTNLPLRFCRQYRGIFIAMGSAVASVTLVSELWLHQPLHSSLLNVSVTGLLFMAFNLSNFTLKPGFLAQQVAGEKPSSHPAPAAVDEVDRSDFDEVLASLSEFMEKQQIYKEHGLTVTRLAECVGVPAYRLRKVINQHMNYSNFNQYLNKYRIQDACNQLVAPKTRHLPILSIALDVGYRSLSSFNKTFKEQMGRTPTEFRKEHKLPTIG